MDDINPYESPQSCQPRQGYTLHPLFLPILWVVLSIHVVPVAIAVGVEFTHGPQATDSLLGFGFLAAVIVTTTSIAWLMFRGGMRRLVKLTRKK